MKLRLGLGTLLGCAMVLAGCASDPDRGSKGQLGDGSGPQDAAGSPTEGTRTLALLSERRLGLAFGEQALLRVALTRTSDSAPVPGAHVSFAFAGVAPDASLGALSTATDGEGVAENTLTVGEFVGTFNVMISAPGAAPLTVQVSVGNAGFGTLVVRAPYKGERQVRRRRIAIVPDAACEDATPGVGDHVELLSEPDADALFLLPAQADYAVVAFAHGLDDTVLAQGCTLAEGIEADVETTVEVDFLDQRLESTGAFELEAELSALEPAATLGAVIELQAVAYIETDRDQVRSADGADARLLLDALEDLLRSPGYRDAGGDALADDIVAERSLPSLDPALALELQTALDGDAMPATGPRLAAARLAQDTADNLATVTLRAQLTIDADNGDAPLSWAPLALDAGVLKSGKDGPVVDLSSQEPAEVSATLLAQDDSIDVQRARFALPWGGLAGAVLRAVVTDQLAADPSVLRARFGCDVFSQWVADTALISSGCDGTCAQAACGLALDRTVDAVAAALLDVDEARPTVTMWGRLSLYDDTGDLAVERMDVEQLRGEWDDAPDGPPERFEGAASGQVLLNVIER